MTRLAAVLLVLTVVVAACTAEEPLPAAAPYAAIENPPKAQPEAPTTTTSPATTTTTTTPASTTTSSSAPTTTTRPSTTTSTTTTTTAPPNAPPQVRITAPEDLSDYEAAYDPETQLFGARVTFSATASDPDGDPVTVRWYSSRDGLLGEGETITATLYTVFDSSQPYITARATDPYGGVATDTIQVIVWIPSDEA